MSPGYTKEQLAAVHSIETDILADVIRVCEENGITYFSVGGTTLGALRHDGFIPWDDDIDIGMLREDYERFLAVAPKALAAENHLQWFGTEPAAPSYFAKVRRNGTEFVEDGTEGIDIHKGIFVDVMPFDDIPENRLLLRIYRARSFFWMNIYIAKTIKVICIPMSPVKKAVLQAMRTVMNALLRPIPKRWLFDKFDSVLRAYNGKGYKRASSRGYKMFEVEKSCLVPTVSHRFEDMVIQIPNDADKVMTIQYGDYMQLPPEEKRVTHRPIRLSY